MEVTRVEESSKKKKSKPNEKWNNFVMINPSQGILRGSRSIFDKKFKLSSRGKQGTAASVVAIVYAHLFDPSKWISGFVDYCLEYGDRLYRSSIVGNRLKQDEQITTCALQQEFYLGIYKCRVCTESPAVFGNLTTESSSAPNLNDGLRKFLEPQNFGVLTCQGSSFGIWHHPTCGYFSFNPSSTDEYGRRIKNGSACLIRSKTIEGLIGVIKDNLNEKCDTRYCIDKVCLVQVKSIGQGKYGTENACHLPIEDRVLQSLNPVDSQPRKECPSTKTEILRKTPLTIEITNYAVESKFASIPMVQQQLEDERYTYDEIKVNVPMSFVSAGPGVMLLHGKTHEMEDLYKAKGAQTVANCVMAIGYKTMHPVRTWTRESLDDVLRIGDHIYAELKANRSDIHTMTGADLDDARFKIEGRKMIVIVDLITVAGTIVSRMPSVLSLKRGLDEFFINNNDGVLECSGTAFAVWTQNDYFYLFDPRSCDSTGLRVVETKNGNNGKTSDEKEVRGKCCTIRFDSLNLLDNHILKNLDPAKNKDRFTIRRVDVVEDVPGIREWNNFRPGIVGKSWIIRGNMNSEDEIFDDHSRGVQGLGMHVAALASAKIIPPSKLCRDDLDDIVREGDAYYNWCVPATEEGDVEERTMDVRTMKRQFYFNNRKVEIDIYDTCVIGGLLAVSDSDLPCLEQGIINFFKKFQYGIVECVNRYYAIWKFEEELKDKTIETSYYLFNEKPDEKFVQQMDLDGNKMKLDACVMRFLDPMEIGLILKDQFVIKENTEPIEYAIHGIKVVSVSEPMTSEEIRKDKVAYVKPELGSYAALGENGAYLEGSISQNNEKLFKNDTVDKQQSANALITLAMTKLFNSFLWYREMIDDILKMGDKLTDKNLSNILDMDEDATETRKYLLPNEIVNEFSIGVNQITFELEEDNVLGKLDELSTSLEDFFRNYKMGIFRQDQVILPIWKEDNAYFTMNPRGVRNAKAAVYWYTDIPYLIDLLIESTIDPDGEFSIDGIDMKNHYEESERPSNEFITETSWYNFSKDSEGVWKINCDIDETNKDISEQYRKKQSAAISVVAIIFSKIYEPRHWSKEILNVINVTGEKLHFKNAERFDENRSFHPKELINEFFLANRRIHLYVQDCVEAGTLGTVKNVNIQNLEHGIKNFFKKYIAGCLTVSNTRHYGIWKYEETFFCFEPGFSLIRFETIQLLTTFLWMLGDSDYDYEITSIDVVDWNKLPPWKFDPSPSVRPSSLPPLNAYSKLPGRARGILRGSTHQSSDIFSETVRGRQTAANCIISLAMAVIKNPITWTKKTLDEILAIGVNLHHETCKMQPDINTPKPKDIFRIFHIGVNILAADVDCVLTGLVNNPPVEPEEKPSKNGKNGKNGKNAKNDKNSKNSKNGKKKMNNIPTIAPPILLEEGLNIFFEKNNAGILVIGRFMISIWKDNGIYFIYDPRPRDRQGRKINDDSDGKSCVLWFACKEPFFDRISANIDDDEKYAKFEIFRIVVRTVPIEPLPSPAGYKPTKEAVLRPEKSDCPTPAVLPVDISENRRSNKLIIDLETSFARVDEEVSVLLGTCHMSERKFPSTNRGYQSTAIAAVACVVASLHAPSTWTTELIDAVLRNGDVLHTECVRLFQPGGRNVTPFELVDLFVVGDVRARIRVHQNFTAGITLDHDLIAAFKLFFGSSVSTMGILHTANYAIVVMQHWQKFYFLDPSDRSGFKKNEYDKVACLFKCDNLTKFAKVILQVCGFKDPVVYTLNPVQILDLHFFAR